MSRAGLGTVLWLALRSLRDRRLGVSITVLTIALSVALLLSVTGLQRSAQRSFEGAISQTDLVVGPRGGAAQLLLYSVFRLGSPTANVSYEDYESLSEHPAVDWTIPISLGDSHRGYRVVATNESYYEHYRVHDDEALRFEEGVAPSGIWDVAVGSAVADELGYELGAELVVSHGLVTTGFTDHGRTPFVLRGILAPTGTPIDRSVFVTLEGFETMHMVDPSGVPSEVPSRDELAAALESGLEIDEVTAVFVGTNRRADALGLQREINTNEDSHLMAVLPGATMAELWRAVGYAERALLLVAAFVVLVGMLGMAMTIYASLEARRREMAILRSLGAGPGTIGGLLAWEAAFLSAAGALLGLALYYLIALVLQPILRRSFGLHLALEPPGAIEWAFLAAVVLLGSAMAIPPAVKAYRNALSDGLAARL